MSCPECFKGIGHMLSCSQHPDAEQADEIRALLSWPEVTIPPQPPRGYSPEIGKPLQGGAFFDTISQRVCLRCGAVVANTRAHDLWHGGIDR